MIVIVEAAALVLVRTARSLWDVWHWRAEIRVDRAYGRTFRDAVQRELTCPRCPCCSALLLGVSTGRMHWPQPHYGCPIHDVVLPKEWG